MIYDRLLEVFSPKQPESPLSMKLELESAHYCAPLTVYHRTYFDSLQMGETVDRMVQLPRLSEIDATMYAVLEGGPVYKIMEAQPTQDEDGLDVYVLSLHRKEGKYELFRPD